MLTGVHRLGLEVTDLDAARAFYEDRLGFVPDAEPTGDSGSRVAYGIGAPNDGTSAADDAGTTRLVLRRPTDVPRGGVHTHYAFATTPEAYERWWDRLADLDPVEFSFGATDSLYVFDPAGHCVEIGGFDRDGDGAGGSDAAAGAADADPTAIPPVSDLFEVVLEVRDLPAAEDRYRRLGFEVVDRGDNRRRVRLSGPVDLELWEPQLGIADARGGLHVDLAFTTDDPEAAVEAGGPWPGGMASVPGGLRVVDGDGHVVTFLREGDAA
ncbi:VOC family protein [Halobellus ruber]|uniref:VOC family protein n=1 Tax=Halobellus ruber TaxID=2761102 RepID=A0A7J9SEB7_9EURY|nr:VOC family protein [Halobellus ruber]MBB6645250.1 VOC family protein [Halobellus ruber]